jgi:aryl-alcohol dehydrogenase-like predicted oxidoreductase
MKRIKGNLTPKMALEILGDLREAKNTCDSYGVTSKAARTLAKVETMFTDHVRAAVERSARRR